MFASVGLNSLKRNYFLPTCGHFIQHVGENKIILATTLLFPLSPSPTNQVMHKGWDVKTEFGTINISTYLRSTRSLFIQSMCA